jgi:DNA-binding CsgD family transcriptional regulator
VPKRFPPGKRSALPKTGQRSNLVHGLTARECEILFWVGRGKSNAEIAMILEIKPATVGKHLEHIYPKLGVENRTAAASFSPERGHI